MIRDAVTPAYPALARLARVRGVVILDILVDEKGAVAEGRVVYGHPLLLRSAIDAVQYWKYSPAKADGVPVPARINVAVNYRLVPPEPDK